MAVTAIPYQWEGPYAKWREESRALHDEALCADVRCDWMDEGDRLLLRCCETVGWPGAFLYDDHYPPSEPEGRGRPYRHQTIRWIENQNGASLSARCDVPNLGSLSVGLVAREDCVDIDLAITNATANVVGPVDWAFCVIGLECKSISDASFTRTLVHDGDSFRSFAEIAGSPKCCLHQVAGANGFVPASLTHVPRSDFLVDHSITIVESVCSRYCAALAFEQAGNAYGSIGNNCFHCDPHFGYLQPGMTKRVHGKLYLIEGNMHQALDRYQKDFPNKARVATADAM